MARHRIAFFAGTLLWLAVSSAVAQAPAPDAAAQAPAPEAASAEAAQKPAEAALPTWYAQALARGTAGLNVTHFWSKGAMLRTETVVAGHKIVTIVKGDWYYAYDALTGRGLAIRRGAEAIARDATIGRPFGREYESLLRQGAELVREETLLGRKTGVFRVTDRLGQRELWVTLDEQRLPLRVEIYDRATTRRRYTDYLNWQSQLAIPNEFFEPHPTANLQKIELLDYLERTSREGPVGPVPVLYADLLHIRQDE
jgi:outer membrane lipoprotein-sorting protein